MLPQPLHDARSPFRGHGIQRIGLPCHHGTEHGRKRFPIQLPDAQRLIPRENQLGLDDLRSAEYRPTAYFRQRPRP